MELQKRNKSPHALSAGKQKKLFESGPPFPTRQLPIYAEQLENSPATRVYKNKKFQAWLTPWCPPPFGAWDALAVAKASSVSFGPLCRRFASACTTPLGWGARVRASADSFHGLARNRTGKQNSGAASFRAGYKGRPSCPSPTCLPNTPAQLVYRAGKKPKFLALPALNFITSGRTQPLGEGG